MNVEVIPNELWVRMQELWQREMTSTEIGPRTDSLTDRPRTALDQEGRVTLHDYCEVVAEKIFEDAKTAMEGASSELTNSDGLFQATWLGHLSAMQYQAWLHLRPLNVSESEKYTREVMAQLGQAARGIGWHSYGEQVIQSIDRYTAALQEEDHQKMSTGIGKAFSLDYDPAQAMDIALWLYGREKFSSWMRTHKGFIDKRYGSSRL